MRKIICSITAILVITVGYCQYDATSKGECHNLECNSKYSLDPTLIFYYYKDSVCTWDKKGVDKVKYDMWQNCLSHVTYHSGPDDIRIYMLLMYEPIHREMVRGKYLPEIYNGKHLNNFFKKWHDGFCGNYGIAEKHWILKSVALMNQEGNSDDWLKESMYTRMLAERAIKRYLERGGPSAIHP